MTLELVVGPVRSGKLGVLLDRFASACQAGQRPLLLVPAAFERDALERDACARAGGVLGGEIVTLDALIERVLGGEVEVASEALDRVLRRRIGHTHGAALGLRPVALASALERLARECDRAGAAPGALERAPGGDARLAPAYAAYEAALAATGRARRGQLVGAGRRAPRARARRLGRRAGLRVRVRRSLACAAAPAGGARRALRPPARAPVRAGAAAARLARRRLRVAGGARRASRGAARGGRTARLPSVVALARGAFSARSEPPPPADGAVRLVEAAGTDGEATAVAARGLPAPAPRAVGRRGARRDARRLRLRAARGRAGACGRRASRWTRASASRACPPGMPCAALCRVAWADGDRDDLFAWLRLAGSSWDALARARLRGAAARPQHRRCRAQPSASCWLPSRRGPSPS